MLFQNDMQREAVTDKLIEVLNHVEHTPNEDKPQVLTKMFMEANDDVKAWTVDFLNLCIDSIQKSDAQAMKDKALPALKVVKTVLTM